MTIIKIIEIIALVAGVPYMVLEVLQKNGMWYFGIFTSTACAIQFGLEHNWANMGLNIYYVAMAFWGLYKWGQDSRKMKKEATAGGKVIHLRHLGLWKGLLSLLLFAVGGTALFLVLKATGAQNPFFDAFSTALCVVAMIWLAESVPYHWVLWIIGDIFLVIMCYMEQKYLMTALYATYVAASSYGLFHWFRSGQYIDD